jgi:hypothetical protein
MAEKRLNTKGMQIASRWESKRRPALASQFETITECFISIDIPRVVIKNTLRLMDRPASSRRMETPGALSGRSMR